MAIKSHEQWAEHRNLAKLSHEHEFFHQICHEHPVFDRFFSKLAYFSAWLQEASTWVHKSTQFINLQTSIIDLYQKFSWVYWNLSVQLSFHLDNSGKFVHEMFIGILPWTNEHAWTNEHEQWTWTFLPSNLIKINLKFFTDWKFTVQNRF